MAGGKWIRFTGQLETLVTGLEDELELSAALGSIRQRYEVALQKMAVGFTAALQQAKWQIEGVAAHTSVYPQFVSVGGGPVAYFLVDAMRYEMAQELASQIGSTAAVQVHYRRSRDSVDYKNRDGRITARWRGKFHSNRRKRETRSTRRWQLSV